MEARDSDGQPAGELDTEAWFGRSAPLVLEIGCGAGISTLAMAIDEPDLDVIAVEVYRRGLAQLLSAVDREGLTNVRLIRGDGVDVLEHLLTSGSLTGVRVFFPDPWPKARHHKRRLLQPSTVALIADRLSRAASCTPPPTTPGTPNRSPRSATPSRCCVGSARRFRRTLPISVQPTGHQVRGEGAPRRQRHHRILWTKSQLRKGFAHERRRGHRAAATPSPRQPRRRSPLPQRVLLVWDAPNLDMGLGSILGGRPTAAHRPRFDALGRWLLARTAELVRRRTDEQPAVSLEPEATVFTNIAPGSADVVRPWVEALRNVGFAVFAKPKIDDDSDVDSDMLDHIALRRREGLASVYRRLRRRSGVPAATRGHRPRRHRRARSRISRTCQLGASVGYLGVCRPGGHPRCLQGAATANRP